MIRPQPLARSQCRRKAGACNATRSISIDKRRCQLFVESVTSGTRRMTPSQDRRRQQSRAPRRPVRVRRCWEVRLLTWPMSSELASMLAALLAAAIRMAERAASARGVRARDHSQPDRPGTNAAASSASFDGSRGTLARPGRIFLSGRGQQAVAVTGDRLPASRCRCRSLRVEIARCRGSTSPSSVRGQGHWPRASDAPLVDFDDDRRVLSTVRDWSRWNESNQNDCSRVFHTGSRPIAWRAARA